MSTDLGFTSGAGIRLRKSRSGCATCKARRVKCDEIKPVCSNCRRRFVNIERCEYGPVLARRKATSKALQESNTSLGDPMSGVSLHPPAVEQSGQWRSIELLLMHHYTRHVAATMSPCGGPMNMWLDIIPRMAFESEVVLNPMLALSAMHLGAHAGNDHRMSMAAARYLDRTLVGHRKAIPNFNGALAEPVWLSAVMLANLCWIAGHETRDNEQYELPMLYWAVRDNVAQLFISQSDRLKQMGYAWVGSERLPDEVLTEDLTENEQRQMRVIEGELDALWLGFDVEAEKDAGRKAAYDEARDYVLMVYRGFFSGMPSTLLRRFVGTVTTRCRLGLRILLEAYDPLAMILLAYLTVLIKAKGLGVRWWMNGKGRYEVATKSVRGIQGLLPEKYHWAMRWPCRVLDGEFALGRSEELIPVDDEETVLADKLVY